VLGVQRGEQWPRWTHRVRHGDTVAVLGRVRARGHGVSAAFTAPTILSRDGIMPRNAARRHRSRCRRPE